MNTLLAILLIVAVVWLIIVFAAHLPLWLLALILILILVGVLA